MSTFRSALFQQTLDDFLAAHSATPATASHRQVNGTASGQWLVTIAQVDHGSRTASYGHASPTLSSSCHPLLNTRLSMLNETIGVESPPGDWHTVTQDQIDAFARTTLDNQFIHTDPVRAARESPFGTTIAHGFLTLSLISHLVRSIPRPKDDPDEAALVGINYGLERVRFPVSRAGQFATPRPAVAADGRNEGRAARCK